MTKLIALLLLVLLPLQVGFAGAAEYCEGVGVHKSHFGHHAHKSASSAEQPDGKSGIDRSAGDCGFCHLGCAHAAVSRFDAPLFVQALERLLFRPDLLIEVVPPLLDRPPRPALA